MYGVGSTYVYDIDETLRRLGWPVRGYVANVAGGSRPDDLHPVVDAADLPGEWRALPVVLVPFTPGHRAAIEREALSLGFTAFPAVVDPSAVVASTVTIGEGAVVNAGVVIGARTTIGRFASVNRSASVGHDVVVEDYASLGPACVVCGTCHIEAGAFVGAGATLVPHVTVGRNAVVGAGTVVLRAVAPHTLVAGNPAKVVKDLIAGYNGVGVGVDGGG